jgi:uncharacterized protein DUF5659
MLKNSSPNNMHYEELYYTSEKDYAALLMAMNQPLVSFYRFRGKYIFVFSNAVKCQKAIRDFSKHSLILNARSVFMAIRTVQGMTKSNKKIK